MSRLEQKQSLSDVLDELDYLLTEDNPTHFFNKQRISRLIACIGGSLCAAILSIIVIFCMVSIKHKENAKGVEAGIISHGLEIIDESSENLIKMKESQGASGINVIAFDIPPAEENDIRRFMRGEFHFDDPFQSVESSGMSKPNKSVVEIDLDMALHSEQEQEQQYATVPVTPVMPGTQDTLLEFGVAVGNEVNWSDFASGINIGGVVGRVTIPALGVTDVVVRYGDQPEIDIGLCQYSLFELPGMEGITMLCAHNYNPNWKIGNLKEGDMLYYNTIYGQYSFRVREAIINQDGRSDYWMKDSYFRWNKSDMVLMTCYPFDHDGSNGLRYIVACSLVSGPKVVGAPTTFWQTYKTFDKYIEKVSGNKID